MVRKPRNADLEAIRNILSQWTEQDEVDKYCERIQSEINGIIEYNTRFWVVENDGVVLGIGGISDPLPKVMQFTESTTENISEIKILYLDANARGKGLGKELLYALEAEITAQSKKEILIRSAVCYKKTAYDFYLHQGYKVVGSVDDNMAVFQKKLNS